MSIIVQCAGCGKKYQLVDSLAGKRVRCKACGQPIAIPPGALAPGVTPAARAGTGAKAAAPRAARSAPPSASPAAVKPARTALRTATIQPAAAPEPAIDLMALMDQERQATTEIATIAAPPPRQSAPPRQARALPFGAADPPKGGRLSLKSGPLKWVVILALLGVIAAAIGIFAASRVGNQMDWGSTLLLTGLVSLGVGHFWVLLVAYKEGSGCATMCQFVPFYGLFYMLSRLDRCLVPACLYIGGIGLVLVTSLAIKPGHPGNAGNLGNPGGSADVSANDPETLTRNFDHQKMDAAIARAQGTFDQFLARFRHPQPGDSDFMVKVRIEDSHGTEHFWLTNLALDSEPYLGTIDNDPGLVTKVTLGQRYGFSRSQISDWAYMSHGVMQGNATLHVELESMPADKAAAVRSKVGWH